MVVGYGIMVRTGIDTGSCAILEKSMKEMVSIEKDLYTKLLQTKENYHKQKQTTMKLFQDYRDLEKRYYELLTTKQIAEEIVRLGNYVSCLD